ncbi:WapI family immunity protein [Flavobacterium hydatis]|uniref:Uncharacterized protein n=1 Tax=Flavobacterium hydatis TaxID=991 RepID=A0A086A5M7_FLAHY|nr:hypothetical protein [Flavobacterium hydatis]KFF11991.1 hypothetical protein IW20_18680 [Flavobacterium hydatis]OXA94263.1 hypothetical protein B0A62_11440 [Flavobacterium hydatis]
MLIKDDYKQFSLTINSYEFQFSNFKEDLNWLNITIYAQDYENRWKSSGAFLNTFELVNLYNWFLALKNDSMLSSTRIDFLEHELSFSYKGNEQILIVNLDFNFHPNKDKYVYGVDEEYKINFDLKSLELESILSSLEKDLKKYPIR